MAANAAIPRTRTVPMQGADANRPCPRTVHIRVQSTPTGAWQQTVRIHGFATAFTRPQSSVNWQWHDCECPQSVRRPEQSTPMNCHRPAIGPRIFNRQRIDPRRRIAVSIWPSTSFPVHIQIIPPMSSFDPAEVRKAVAEFTPRRPQKFQDLLPAKGGHH